MVLGSRDSFDYTGIGDTINLAARLESLCKFYQVPLLFSQEFWEAAQRQGCEEQVRLVDRARVKGKAQPTTVYTVSDAARPEFDEAYRKALAMFRLGNWATALEFLNSALSLRSEDPLCRLYEERCQEFLRQPPPSWDGVMTLKSK